MSCDHLFVENHLLAYLDSSLEPAMARAFEKTIDQCAICRDLYQGAVTAHQWQQQWQDLPVPDWRRADFVLPKTNHSRMTWFNWTSLATSILALSMVIFRVEFISTEHGLTISFAGKGSQSQITAQIEQRLNQLTHQQANAIENRFAEYQLQQISHNETLLNTVLQRNRQERRQDMNLLMATWLQQRNSDQHKMNQKVDYLLDNQIHNSQYLNQVLKIAH